MHVERDYLRNGQLHIMATEDTTKTKRHYFDKLIHGRVEASFDKKLKTTDHTILNNYGVSIKYPKKHVIFLDV